MNLIWLTFRDPVAERAYEDFVFQKNVNADAISVLASIVLSSCFAVKVWMAGYSFDSVPFWAAVLMVVGYLANAVLIAGRPWDVYRQWRTTVTVICRLWVVISFAVAESYAYWIYLPASGISLLIQACALHEGGASLVRSLGLRIKFVYYAPLQLASMIILMLGKGTVMCKCILNSPVGDHYAELGASILSQVDSFVCYWCNCCKTSLDASKMDVCLQFSFFFHIVYGFGVITYLVWLVERCSRLSFVKSGLEEGEVSVAYFSLRIWMYHVHACFTLVVLSWSWFSWVPGFIKQYGSSNLDVCV